MPLPMEPYRHHVTGNPRPASTYRGARRNAARSCKAQVLKQFRLWAGGWRQPRELSMPRSWTDRWRHDDPRAYRYWWLEFLAAHAA
jgi:hypothetical protein